MKEKSSYKKSLLFVSLILGILVSLQIKNIYLQNNGMNTSKVGEQLEEELKSLNEIEKKLKQEIDNTDKEIDKYKNLEENNDNIIYSEINKYKELAGYTELKGPGVEIILKSKQPDLTTDVANNILYNYDLLLSIMNSLNSAQSEAISVNDIRIVSDSYIHLKGENLYINDNVITEPIIIKSIGNPKTLASALNIRYGIIWEMEKYYNIDAIVNEKSEIIIKEKVGTLQIDNANIYKEDINGE